MCEGDEPIANDELGSAKLSSPLLVVMLSNIAVVNVCTVIDRSPPGIPGSIHYSLHDCLLL